MKVAEKRVDLASRATCSTRAACRRPTQGTMRHRKTALRWGFPRVLREHKARRLYACCETERPYTTHLKGRVAGVLEKISRRADLEVRAGEKVDSIARGRDSIFTVTTQKGLYRAHAVVLVLGWRGMPRKLGIKGEELPKVMYSLIEAGAYTGANILSRRLHQLSDNQEIIKPGGFRTGCLGHMDYWFGFSLVPYILLARS